MSNENFAEQIYKEGDSVLDLAMKQGRLFQALDYLLKRDIGAEIEEDTKLVLTILRSNNLTYYFDFSLKDVPIKGPERSEINPEIAAMHAATEEV